MPRRAFVGLTAGVVQAEPGLESVRAIERNIFDAVNRERRSRRLPALVWSEVLAAEARRHSEEMARKGYFGHRDPKRGALAERIRAAGIEYTACGENVYGQARLAGAATAAVNGWMGSRGHRSNLLSAVYRETAVGVAVDAGGRCKITQIFLARANGQGAE